MFCNVWYLYELMCCRMCFPTFYLYFWVWNGNLRIIYRLCNEQHRHWIQSATINLYRVLHCKKYVKTMVEKRDAINNMMFLLHRRSMSSIIQFAIYLKSLHFCEVSMCLSIHFSLHRLPQIVSNLTFLYILLDLSSSDV